MHAAYVTLSPEAIGCCLHVYVGVEGVVFALRECGGSKQLR